MQTGKQSTQILAYMRSFNKGKRWFEKATAFDLLPSGQVQLVNCKNRPVCTLSSSFICEHERRTLENNHSRYRVSV